MRSVLVRCLLLVGVALSAGCPSVPPQFGQSPSDGGTPAWATEVLGAPPQRYLALRMSRAPGLRSEWRIRNGMKSIARAAMYSCRQLDVYNDGMADELMVLHDVPPSLDLSRPVPPAFAAPDVTAGADGDFRVFAQTRSGARSYIQVSPSGAPRGDGRPTILVLPPSTWVFGDALEIARAEIAFDQGRGAPDLVTDGPDVIAESYVVGANLPPWLPSAQAARGSGFVFFAAPTGSVALRTVYADASTADAGARQLKELWARRAIPSGWVSGFEEGITDVHSSGNVIFVNSQLSLHDAVSLANDL